jgi:cytochrome P450
VTHATVSDATLFSQACRDDPYPFYAEWREHAPVWWSEAMGGYIVTRYADVRRGLSEPERFAQSHRFDGALSDALGLEPLVMLDPPLHTELRRAFGASFRPAVLEARLAPLIERIAGALVGELEPGEPFELNARIGSRVAMDVMAALIGSESTPELRGLYRAVLEYIRVSRMGADALDDGAVEAGRAAGRDLMRYLGELRDGAPRADGLNLVHVLTESGAIDRKLIVATCANLLVAGVETSTSGIATAMFALLSHSGVEAAVRREPRLARQAFDEALRWNSPLQFVGRRVREPVTLAGTDLDDGDELLLFVGSANRDPERYAQPETFSLGRANTDHLAFGRGIHLCLGAPVVRVEARAIIGRLLERFPGLSLDRDRLPRFSGGPATRVFDELWLVPGREATR